MVNVIKQHIIYTNKSFVIPDLNTIYNYDTDNFEILDSNINTIKPIEFKKSNQEELLKLISNIENRLVNNINLPIIEKQDNLWISIGVGDFTSEDIGIKYTN